MEGQKFKRHVAYKLKIGAILSGKPFFEEDRFRLMEIGEKQVARVNVIANITEKFEQEGEKKYSTITLDDASGQLKVKTFGEETEKLSGFEQGDTVVVIGLLRFWNNEPYIMPEVIKKKNPIYLLIRKLETELQKPAIVDKSELNKIRDQIIQVLKKEESNGGAEIEKIILELKSSPEIINKEVKRLLEDGVAYEPRPGKLRYLG